MMHSIDGPLLFRYVPDSCCHRHVVDYCVFLFLIIFPLYPAPTLAPITTSRKTLRPSPPTIELSLFSKKEQHEFHFFPSLVYENLSTSTILPPRPPPPPRRKALLLLNRKSTCAHDSSLINWYVLLLSPLFGLIGSNSHCVFFCRLLASPC